MIPSASPSKDPDVQSTGSHTIVYTATNVVKQDKFTRTLNVVAEPTITLLPSSELEKGNG